MYKRQQKAYQADITYGTNNEFGFDYLRDNMAIYAAEMVQRGHAFAIVDEVDSILIDEARTPLIISGQGDQSTQLYTCLLYTSRSCHRRWCPVSRSVLAAPCSHILLSARARPGVVFRLFYHKSGAGATCGRERTAVPAFYMTYRGRALRQKIEKRARGCAPVFGG